MESIASKKKDNITLSIDKIVIDDRKSEAAENGKSLNNKVNEILNDYVMYPRTINHEHPVITFPSLFLRLIEEIPEEVIVMIFLMGIRVSNPFLLATMDDDSSSTEALRRMLAFGHRIGLYEKYFIQDRANHVILIFSHRYDIKWSKGISVSFAEMIERLLQVHPTVERTKEKVIIRIPK